MRNLLGCVDVFSNDILLPSSGREVSAPGDGARGAEERPQQPLRVRAQPAAEQQLEQI